MITVDLVQPENCMTCNGATIADLARQNIVHGSIPLCDNHAELMLNASRDIERARRATLASPDSEMP